MIKSKDGTIFVNTDVEAKQCADDEGVTTEYNRLEELIKNKTEEIQSRFREKNRNYLNKIEAVDHPAHYADGRKYEPIDVIEDWELGFCLGNTVKYISRAGRKNDAVEDLKKAMWYLQREIERRSEKRE